MKLTFPAALRRAAATTRAFSRRACPENPGPAGNEPAAGEAVAPAGSSESAAVEDVDDLEQAVRALGRFRASVIRDGPDVDLDSVRDRLAAAEFGTAMSELTTELATRYRRCGDYQRAAGLRMAAWKFRSADEQFGNDEGE